MDPCVCPASDCVDGGVFPGLKTVAMIEVMGRLPVVEYLVAIMDWRVEGGDEASKEDDVKGHHGLEGGRLT